MISKTEKYLVILVFAKQHILTIFFPLNCVLTQTVSSSVPNATQTTRIVYLADNIKIENCLALNAYV
jgi:hypothetical protein